VHEFFEHAPADVRSNRKQASGLISCQGHSREVLVFVVKTPQEDLASGWVSPF
jgi:hypothetical protein